MRHHNLTLASAWEHEASTEVTGFAVEPDAETPAQCRGRAAVPINCGSFRLHLQLTPAELRAMAALLLATAADQESLNTAAAAPTTTGAAL